MTLNPDFKGTPFLNGRTMSMTFLSRTIIGISHIE